jgi:hypothetical protein
LEFQLWDDSRLSGSIWNIPNDLEVFYGQISGVLLLPHQILEGISRKNRIYSKIIQK